MVLPIDSSHSRSKPSHLNSLSLLGAPRIFLLKSLQYGFCSLPRRTRVIYCLSYLIDNRICHWSFSFIDTILFSNLSFLTASSHLLWRPLFLHCSLKHWGPARLWYRLFSLLHLCTSQGEPILPYGLKYHLSSRYFRLSHKQLLTPDLCISSPSS